MVRFKRRHCGAFCTGKMEWENNNYLLWLDILVEKGKRWQVLQNYSILSAENVPFLIVFSTLDSGRTVIIY